MATAAEVQTLTKELQKLKDDRKADTDELVKLRERNPRRLSGERFKCR